MSPTLRIAILLALAIGALVLLAIVVRKWQRYLVVQLPPREECLNYTDALSKATAWAIDNDAGAVLSVLGTGSMAPYIPKAAPGFDPNTTVVAIAVTEKDAAFSEVKVGKLCTYHPAWNVKAHVVHQAVSRQGDGWIMSGLHNPRSETSWSMQAHNFTGIVARVYVWQ